MSQGELSTAPILNADKIKYLKKLLFTNFLGGIKLSDPDNDLEINGFGWFFQILMYILFPAIIIATSIALSDPLPAALIAGGACGVLNLGIQFYIYNLTRKKN